MSDRLRSRQYVWSPQISIVVAMISSIVVIIISSSSSSVITISSSSSSSIISIISIIIIITVALRIWPAAPARSAEDIIQEQPLASVSYYNIVE